MYSIQLILIQFFVQQIYSMSISLPGNSNLESFDRRIYQELQQDNTLIIVYETEDQFVNNIVKFAFTRTIVQPKLNNELLNTSEKYHSYIIIIRNLLDLKACIDIFTHSSNWNSKAKYLIVVYNETLNIENIFKIVWKFWMFNVNVLKITDLSFKMFTFFPYGNGSCGDNWTPIELQHNHGELFPEKLQRNMQGCKIKLMGVRILPYVVDITAPKENPSEAGLEVIIINNIFAKMNLSQIYIPNTYSHWGYMLPNGNFTMTYKSLYDKQVDIIFGMMIGNVTMAKYFDATVPHIDTTAVWFVPIALPIAQWKNLTVIFDGIVWSSILFVFILNGVVWWMIGKRHEISQSYKELSLCLMGAFYILLQGSFTTPNAWKLRFIVIIWSVSSLLLFTAHQCQLTGILTSPLYEHQISNLEEMVNSDLDFGFYPVLKALYTESTRWDHKKLLQKYKPCPLTAECMNRTAFKRDFATIKNKREAAYLMPKYYQFPSGKPMLYNFKESEFVVWCKYYVSKGFPLLERINEKILQLQSSGLVAKWESDLVSGANGKDEVVELEPLTLNHLQGAFFLLLFGYLISLSVFVGEIFCFKFRKIDNKIINQGTL